MSKYLVVAHQTGDSPMLLDKVRELAESDPGAEFVVLTPRRPITMTMVLTGEKRTASQVATWRTQRTARRLSAAGATVTASRLGAYDPLEAIADELSFETFSGVIISTLPPGLSSWLHLDLPSKVRARWPALEVIHVISPSPFFREDEPGRFPAGQRGSRSGRSV